MSNKNILLYQNVGTVNRNWQWNFWICTFKKPVGSCKLLLLLPFGTSCTTEIFNNKNIEIFGDISGVEVNFDDVIINSNDEVEPDYNLKQVFDSESKYNTKFNSSKLQYKISGEYDNQRMV